MAIKTADEDGGEISRIEEGGCSTVAPKCKENGSLCSSTSVVTMAQKVIAEVIGTFFVIFSGCGVVVVNNLYGGTVTFPGICVTWGLIVMVMIYSVGHISGAHFNPAVTITFAIFRRFPWWEVPIYIAAQIVGSILASGTLSVMFDVTSKAYFGTVPVGSDRQSLAIEIVITFLLMFVISGVATDNRAVRELAGIAVGMTIMLNVFVAGYVCNILRTIQSISAYFRRIDEPSKEHWASHC
ncbi:probable aquaporin NIP4-2 isoform X4 [Rhododendron vialii]|uniref:probable aquaporin NIP4-2 isoform X4 n=1 Tax=Rhododendron vialii TaxID=182163 RepID=UPI002660203F|nr:probable aquaporin NIP4-2 isoform X4 [Rhododendron vialii]